MHNVFWFSHSLFGDFHTRIRLSYVVNTCHQGLHVVTNSHNKHQFSFLFISLAPKSADSTAARNIFAFFPLVVHVWIFLILILVSERFIQLPSRCLKYSTKIQLGFFSTCRRKKGTKQVEKRIHDWHYDILTKVTSFKNEFLWMRENKRRCSFFLIRCIRLHLRIPVV